MMRSPLTLIPLLERAGKLFPNVEIVARRPEGDLFRSTYADFYRRARALAGGLQRCGLRRGERVATLSWNHQMHLEPYFGVPSAGGVLHTLNLRLHPDELAFIANDAEDRFLLVDDVLLPTFEKIKDKTHFERVFVVPFCGKQMKHNFESYDDLLEAGPIEKYPELDEENPAAMCYTSGTTGKPKGVVYSHRALAIHSLCASMPDSFSFSCHDTILPAMSMFHANAWGMPYAAVMNGSRLVFPGPNVQPEMLLELLSGEQVTLTGAVPTVWLGVLDALEKDPGRWPLADGLRVIIAGSACPEQLIRRFDRFGVQVIQAWGLTETAPIATVCRLKPHLEALGEDAQYEIRAKQGVPAPFIEMRTMSDNGEAPWDGQTPGELEVRGPFVADSYYKMSEGDSRGSARWSDDGWFRTGDVATIDPDGYVKITDRSKDLIKSGGEWISSVDLENALVAHPAVAEAAVIAVPHPKWQERPLAVVVLRKGASADADTLRAFLANKFAKWQLPDDVVFVAELPHTSTGKLQKSELRKTYKDWKFQPTQAAT
jgi:fatty-acyl-CoA synthase